MSVTTGEVIAADDARRADPRRPSWWATSTVLVRGQLRWLGWLWASLIALLPIALLVIAGAGGDLTESLWAGADIGWQRWMLFTAGLVTIRTFLREFVSRGVTRRRLADSAAASMLALATISAALGVAGYLIEWVIFRWQDWPLELVADDTMSAGRLARVGIEYALLGAVYFTTGWLVGSAFVRYRWINAIFLIPACFAPVAVVELVVSRDTANFRVNPLPDPLDHPALFLTLAVAVPVVLAAVAVARRVTQTLPLR